MLNTYKVMLQYEINRGKLVPYVFVKHTEINAPVYSKIGRQKHIYAPRQCVGV